MFDLLLILIVLSIVLYRLSKLGTETIIAGLIIIAVLFGLIKGCAALGLPEWLAYAGFALFLAICGITSENVPKGKSQNPPPGKDTPSVQVDAHVCSTFQDSPFEPAEEVMNRRTGLPYFSYDEPHHCLLFSRYASTATGEILHSALHDAAKLMGYYISVNGGTACEGDVPANTTPIPLVFNSLGEPVRMPWDTTPDFKPAILTLAIYFTDTLEGATTGEPGKEEINFLEPPPPNDCTNASTPEKDMLSCVKLLHHIMVKNKFPREK